MKVARMLLVIAAMVVVGQVANAQELSERDQRKVAVQGICPISGQRLGAHGAPIKVTVGQESIFLCCEGCLQREINPEHWATIHANFARAQGICPVMENELPANPKWAIIQGQIIYVCCPPCVEKLEAEPGKYLQALDQLYSASLR